MTLKEAFTKARELLVIGWCQKTYARDKDGHPRDENDSRACCFCAAGAIRSVTRNDWIVNWALRRKMTERLEAKVGHIPAWNDSSTKETVIGVFEEIITELEADLSASPIPA